MFQILVAALAAVTGVNVQGAANRKFYDADTKYHDLGHYVGACLQILVATSLLVFGSIFLWRQSLAAWLGLKVPWVLWAVAVSAAGFLINLRLGQWQVRGHAIKYGLLQVSQSSANMLLSSIFVVALLQGAAGRIIAQISVLPLFAALAAYLLAKDRLLAMSWRPQYVREALLFGIPLIPHVLGLFLLSAADRLMINARLGLGQAGIYMVALQLTMVMTIVFDAINKSYIPWLFERLGRDQPQEKRQIVRWTYAYFGVALTAAGLAFVIGPYAVGLIAGDQYREAGKVIGWLALGQAFGGMYLMVTNYIFYSRRTGMLSFATISSGLLNVVLLIVFVKRFGLVGAAWAFAIAMAVRFVLTWAIAQKRHPMPWLHLREA